MLKVVRAGFFTSIQDRGRFGYRHIGVPVSGVMDSYSASIANNLLENPEDAAVMEITMTGPSLEFEEATYIAISGADLSAKLNDKAVKINQVHQVKEGDTLSFGKLVHGLRAYLAVKNGFGTPVVLNSRSYFKPVTPREVIFDTMELQVEEYRSFEARISSVSPEPFHREHELEVFRGPEYDILNDRQLEGLFGKEFTVAKENNRMAYQLEQTINGHSHTIITSATIPGTVQFTPSGKLIILMKDGQTTGGYPRVLQLSNSAICVLAQKKFGDTVKFHLK
jgi:biotin-dependent carboxylase-like uncharacterized protein